MSEPKGAPDEEERVLSLNDMMAEANSEGWGDPQDDVWTSNEQWKRKKVRKENLGPSKPTFVPPRIPTISKDRFSIIIDGIPKEWSQSQFLRSFATIRPDFSISSVRQLNGGGWILRMTTKESAEQLLKEGLPTMTNLTTQVTASKLWVHRIGERSPKTLSSQELSTRKIFATIDPACLDCEVEIEAPEFTSDSASFSKMKKEDDLSILKAISKKIDASIFIEEAHKIQAINRKGAFTVEFENKQVADKYIAQGLRMPQLGILLKCKRFISNIAEFTHVCKLCCQMGHKENRCNKKNMCRICGEIGHSASNGSCPKNQWHPASDPVKMKLFCVFCCGHVGHLAGANSCPNVKKIKHLAIRNLQTSLAPSIPHVINPPPPAKIQLHMSSPLHAGKSVVC